MSIREISTGHLPSVVSIAIADDLDEAKTFH